MFWLQFSGNMSFLSHTADCWLRICLWIYHLYMVRTNSQLQQRFSVTSNCFEKENRYKTHQRFNWMFVDMVVCWCSYIYVCVCVCVYIYIYISWFEKTKKALPAFTAPKKRIQTFKLGCRHLCLNQQIEVFRGSTRCPTGSLKSCSCI